MDPEPYSLPESGIASIDSCLMLFTLDNLKKKKKKGLCKQGGKSSPHKESIKLKREQGETMLTHQIGKD